MKHPSYLRNLEESDHQCHSGLPAVWFWMALWHTMGGQIVRPRIVSPDPKTRKKNIFFLSLFQSISHYFNITDFTQYQTMGYWHRWMCPYFDKTSCLVVEVIYVKWVILSLA